MQNKILCFDLDGVICQTNENDYINSRPIKKNIIIINNLKKKDLELKILQQDEKKMYF